MSFEKKTFRETLEGTPKFKVMHTRVFECGKLKVIGLVKTPTEVSFTAAKFDSEGYPISRVPLRIANPDEHSLISYSVVPVPERGGYTVRLTYYPVPLDSLPGLV